MVWKGPDLASLRAHKALHCTRILQSGGRSYEILAVVDETIVDSGTEPGIYNRIFEIYHTIKRMYANIDSER